MVCSGQLSFLPFAGREMSSRVAYELWGEGLVWLIGAVVCLHAALWVQLFARVGNRWPHIISSCRLAATSEIVKCFWT